MKILSWNIRGITNKKARRELKRLVNEENPNCVWIMESKTLSEFLDQLVGLGFRFCISCSVVGLAGGLLNFVVYMIILTNVC